MISVIVTACLPVSTDGAKTINPKIGIRNRHEIPYSKFKKVAQNMILRFSRSIWNFEPSHLEVASDFDFRIYDGQPANILSQAFNRSLYFGEPVSCAVNLFITRHPLVPPNPNELDMAVLTVARRALLGT